MGERKRQPGSAQQATVRASFPPRPRRKDGRARTPPQTGDSPDGRLFAHLPVALYRATSTGRLIDANPACLRLSGYPDLGTLTAITAADLFADPVTRMRLRAALERDGVIDFESRLRRHDGTFLWVRAYVWAVRDAAGKVQYLESAMIDISERAVAQESLRESEERLQLLARATHDLVWDWNLLTNEGWRGPGADALFGYVGDLDRPWPEWWSENIHPDDREKVLISVRTAINEGGLSWSSDYRFRRANGEYARVQDRGYIIRDANRRPTRMVGAMTDLTDRSAAAEEIRRRAMHLEALNAIIAGAAAAEDLRTLLEGAVDRTMKALDVGMGGIWVGDLHIDRGLPPEVGLLLTHAREKAGENPTGSVAATDWRDASAPMADALAPLQARLGIWASLAAPLETDGRVVGGLAIASPEFRAWLPEETALLASVGKQVGAAVERFQLFGEAQRRARLMGQLVALSDTLTRAVTVPEVTPAIGEAALSLSGSDRAAVFLVQEGVMTCAWSKGLSSRYLSEVLAHQSELTLAQLMREGAELTRVTLPSGRLIEARKPFQIPDVHVLPPEGLTYTLAASEGYRSVGVWPLIHEGRAIGFVSCFYDAPRTWSAVEEEVFLAFSLQATGALQNARLHDAQAQRTAQLEAFYARVLDALTPSDAEKP